MSFLQWLWRLTSNLGWILRSGHSHGRVPVMTALIRIEIKHRFLVKLLKRKITQEKIFGYRVYFFEYETFAVLFEELYVPDMYYFSASSSEPIIIDCGSNIGLAILYFKTLYPNCRITAFEADPVTFKLLERNVRVNKLENVRLINKALYDSKGTVPFYVGFDEPGLLVQSTRKESLSRSKATLVETTLLSDYVTEQIDFLKMDIEGAEDRVIKDLLEQNKLSLIREMVLEYHHHMTPLEDRLGAFLAMLEECKFGYQIRAPLVLPFRRRECQFFLIYGYRN